MSTKKLDALTGLRFFAAFGIVIQHALGNFPFLRPFDLAVPWSNGVSFFYVLSGFVLAYSYPTVNDGKRFIISRVARIYPLHLFSLLARIILVPVRAYAYGSVELIATLLLIQAWVPDGIFVFAGNGVSWSISVELFFYCLFPLLIWGWRRWWIWYFAGGLALVAISAAGAAYFDFGRPSWGEAGLSAPLVAYAFPPSRVFEFILGMGTAKVYSAVRKQEWSLPGRTGSTFMEVAAFASVYWMTMELRPFLWHLNAVYFDSDQTLVKWIASSGTAPGFAVLIFVFAISSGFFHRLLSSWVAVFLGEISFSIYMMHPIVMGVSVAIAGRGLLSFAVCIFATLIVSSLTWALIEKPCRRAILTAYDRFSSRQGPKSKMAEAA